jgi:hypothetical protein
MPKYKFIVFSKPVEGREEEYNDWYQNTHLREVCETPGFVAAQRYKLGHDMAGDGSAYPYCALYDIEADDWSQPFAALADSANGGGMFMSEAIDLSTVKADIYEVFGDEVRRIA